MALVFIGLLAGGINLLRPAWILKTEISTCAACGDQFLGLNGSPATEGLGRGFSA